MDISNDGYLGYGFEKTFTSIFPNQNPIATAQMTKHRKEIVNSRGYL